MRWEAMHQGVFSASPVRWPEPVSELHPFPEERRVRLRAALVDAVRHHLIADVPVGVFLSSRLDSTTLTALEAEGGSLRTVTLGFSEY
jgi:asparagine synthase (glutamine-hydrolysing)